MSGSVKVTVNLPKSVVEAIESLAEKRGITKTEAIRQAVSHEFYLQKAVDGGEKVLIDGGAGKVRELILDTTAAA